MSKKKKLLITFFILLFVYSLQNIVVKVLEDYHSKAKLEELAQSLESSKKVPDEVEAIPGFDTGSREPVILSEYQELYARNPDMVGWLKIAGTRIDYPVMYHPQDAEYYLGHDFDGKEDKNGLPFIDARCGVYDSSTLLIHGHNMKSGLMFGGLIKYKDESYYREHPTVQFDTLYEKGEYEIIAVILSRVYLKSEDVFKYYQVEKNETSDEFDEYIRNIKGLALYDTGVPAQYGDKLIVLSTCEYSVPNGRLAVVARKI